MTLMMVPEGQSTEGQSDVSFWGEDYLSLEYPIGILSLVAQATEEMMLGRAAKESDVAREKEDGYIRRVYRAKQIMDFNDSVIVGFFLDQDMDFKQWAESISRSLDLYPTSGPLHMTLLSLGTKQNLSRSSLMDTLNRLALVEAPIQGVFNGLAVLNTVDNEKTAVLLYDSPQLNHLRTALSEAFGVPQDHGLTPHVTIGNSSEARTTDIYNYPYTFSTLTLFWGSEPLSVPLTGTRIYKHAKRVFK